MGTAVNFKLYKKSLLAQPWTTLEISRNCDYFRGNPEDDRSMNPKRGEPKKGNQTRGIPKRGI